jgi:hypothetical protein
VGEVAVEDLVGKLQVAMVPNLLDVTPEDGLPEPLPLGWVMVLLMLPAEEAWRI